MIYTKQHSKNAVVAKARLRIQRFEHREENKNYKLKIPRKSRARFTIQIRDNKVGDSLTLNLHESPWKNLYFSELGQFSAAKIGKTISLILTNPT